MMRDCNAPHKKNKGPDTQNQRQAEVTRKHCGAVGMSHPFWTQAQQRKHSNKTSKITRLNTQDWSAWKLNTWTRIHKHNQAAVCMPGGGRGALLQSAHVKVNLLIMVVAMPNLTVPCLLALGVQRPFATPGQRE